MTEADTELARTKEVALDAPPHADVIWIPGGTFRMGSDSHYP